MPGDGDGELRGLVLDRIEPMRIGPRIFEQPVARTQRALQRVDAAAVLGIDRERQPIDEAPPLRWRADKQRIHGRHQPDHAQMIGKGGGRTNRLAIDPAFARGGRAVFGRPLDAGAERGKPQRAFDLG